MMLSKIQHLDTCYIIAIQYKVCKRRKPFNFAAYTGNVPDNILDLFYGKFLDNSKVFPVSTKINFS
jgi:hypothetical protein